jgi:hypothetical protein
MAQLLEPAPVWSQLQHAEQVPAWLTHALRELHVAVSAQERVLPQPEPASAR